MSPRTGPPTDLIPPTVPTVRPKGTTVLDLTDLDRDLDAARTRAARDERAEAVRRLAAPSGDNTGAPAGTPVGSPAGPTVGPAVGPRHPARAERRRPDLKKWWARLLVLLMVAGAGYAGMRLVEYRTSQPARTDLGSVTLTARPTTVSPNRGGVVRSVSVDAQQQVAAGQKLGTVLVTEVTPSGRVQEDEVAVKAPSDGVVVAEPLPVGSAVSPGQAFVQLYDPKQMTFVGDVRIADLDHIGRGMTATLTGPGLEKPVTATVDRVVPKVAGTNQPAGTLELVLTPRRAADVASLVPGLQLTATVAADPDGTPTDGSVLDAGLRDGDGS